MRASLGTFCSSILMISGSQDSFKYGDLRALLGRHWHGLVRIKQHGSNGKIAMEIAQRRPLADESWLPDASEFERWRRATANSTIPASLYWLPSEGTETCAEEAA
ncbi:hypothetical protein VTK56DRAFT_667 [Thermocarpiscus australiensis]